MDTYSRWIESYRDLPLLINQWANVVRWELRTRPFLRTAEFLWQEGHTCHATSEEAEEETMKMLNVYKTFAEEWLAIPCIAGQKSESEKFAGADHTYTIETMMQDGKALQSGTSHHLGQNFAKAFDIQFTDRDGQRKHVWTTSWGLSTRLMGGLIMVHSDDEGLVLPPKIAPTQVVILPIYKKKKDQEAVLKVIDEIENMLKGKVRVKVDNRDYLSIGEKHHHWEKRGVPVRIEVGPRDIEQQQVVIARRDTGEKEALKLEMVEGTLPVLMETIQQNLFDKAKKFLDDNTHRVDSYDELKEVVENGGFALAHWDGSAETEEKIQAETKATIRCIPFDEAEEVGKCVVTGKRSRKRVVFAKAY